MIRVCLVDDQTLVRQGIRSLLALAEGIEVIAEAGDGRGGRPLMASMACIAHSGSWPAHRTSDAAASAPLPPPAVTPPPASRARTMALTAAAKKNSGRTYLPAP